jgi:hypothetical protein
MVFFKECFFLVTGKGNIFLMAFLYHLIACLNIIHPLCISLYDCTCLTKIIMTSSAVCKVKDNVIKENSALHNDFAIFQCLIILMT